MLQCLENIVGITKSDCACIVNGLSQAERDAMKLSTSGLYVDKVEGGIEFKAAMHLDSCRNLAQMMTEQRDIAIDTATADLIIALNNRASKSVKPYSGPIGWPGYAKTLPDARQFQGVRLSPRDHTDATVKITRIRLVGNQATALNVYIVKTAYGSGMGGEVVFSGTVNTVANNYAAANLPADGLILPLRRGFDLFEYWIYFDKALTAFLPKDTKLGCNCSSQAVSVLDSYFAVSGVGFADPADMVGTGSFDQNSHGLIIDTEIKCESKALICREMSENEKIALAMAKAVQYKAGELVIEAVLKSGEVNRYTMQQSEYNWGKRNHFRAEYQSRIQFMADALDLSNSDCFECGGSANAMFFTKIAQPQ